MESGDGTLWLTEHTLSLAPGHEGEGSSLDELAWLVGNWTGPTRGGVSEETWSVPGGGAMMGMYRLIREGKPVLYEMMWFLETNSSLVLRLKHFNPDLTAWEEKGKTVDFPFVAKIEGAMHFDGITYRPEGSNAVTVFLAIRHKDGSFAEEEFSYTRHPL